MAFCALLGSLFLDSWSDSKLLMLSIICVSVVFVGFCGVSLRAKLSPLNQFPGPKSQSWIFGTLLQIFEAEHGVPHEEWAELYGPVYVYQCLFGETRLATIDPKAINHVMVTRTEVYPRTKADIRDLDVSLGHGLASVQGETHRRQKKLLLPFFSPTSLKQTSSIFEAEARQLCEIIRLNILEKASQSEPKSDESMATAVIDMYPLYGSAALDIIGKAGFGHSFNALRGPNRVISALNRLFCSAAVQFTGFSFLIRQALREFPMLRKFVRTERVKAMRESLITLKETGWNIFNARKADVLSSLEEENKDLLSLLIRANLEANPEDRLDEVQVMAQIATFIFAGSETTAISLSWASWLMTQHPEVQTKLRKELIQARDSSADGLLDPEAIYALPYLEAFCREVLRFIPIATSLMRQAVSSDKIPLSKPIALKNGEMIDHIPIKAGQTILIPISAYHRSKEIFGPTADQFDPDRWLPDHSKQVKPSLTSTPGSSIGLWAGLMSFSTGPRSCIGYKFAVMEMKVILAHVVLEFKFEERDAQGGPKIERRANNVSYIHCDTRRHRPQPLPDVLSNICPANMCRMFQCHLFVNRTRSAHSESTLDAQIFGALCNLSF